MSITPTPENLANGHERAIARAISWVENQHPGSVELLEQLHGTTPIIGITGPPGAGKSSLVNALALHWSAQNLKTAIVAVDPSSPFNLGSLLGDRLRMPGLFLDPKVYIRSVSARGSLGGLCTSIIEICDVLKHAQFDHIIVETVGVGQSEIEIAGIADTTIVVSVPESGDEVQTLKSGIMEIADIFVVNKSDRDGADAFANHLKKLAHYRMGDGTWESPVVKTIAMDGTGIQALSEAIHTHQTQGISNERKIQLLSDKAYRLIQRNRMRNIS
ncbi:MAG: methylmalonyl Co-A mutase-associated GTPase MeaB, partial [Bacteroidota bacterium]